jgi:type II secretory ATPase GspE/PulE/Tfp pilus assembly ATPase PilB-like protein
VIDAGGPGDLLLAAATARGFRTMNHDGIANVLAGLTTIAEVERQSGPLVVA